MGLTHALDKIPTYRPFGQPANGFIQVKTIPNTGDTVTIDGVAFTYGTDFSGATSAVRGAQGLTSAIRSDIEVSYLNSDKQPIRTFCAVWYQDTVYIFATQPGLAGNSITLATSNTAAFNLSGATLSGGTNGTVSFIASPSASTFTDGSGTITAGGTSQQIFAANSTRKYLLVQNLSSENLYVNFGASATIGAGSILLVPNGSITYDSEVTPSGTVNIVGATTGDVFTAKQA